MNKVVSSESEELDTDMGDDELGDEEIEDEEHYKQEQYTKIERERQQVALSVTNKTKTRSPRTLCRAVFLFLCILNVVVTFYYIFINVQHLWLLHSIGPSP